jgi:hypothetical protein
MTEEDHDARLELAYRRLLLAYPAAYRQARGAELLSTLMAAAPLGRRRPTVAEAVDLVYHGIRTRARTTRRTLYGPDASGALALAAFVSLTVAAAVALAVIVGVSLLGQPVFYRYPERGYPAPVRVGVGLALATFPVALVCMWAGRQRVARWLAVIGSLGTIGLATWLAVHVFDVQDARRAASEVEPQNWLSVPDETLEPSNLFGLVTLLCVPGVLLVATRSTSLDRRRVGWGAALAGLLGTVFVLLTTTDLLQRARLAVLGPEGTSTGPAPSLHDTGLSHGVVIALVAAAAWGLARPPRSQGLAVACALMLPALGYTIGTLVTPVAFRPGWSRTEGLAMNLLEVVVVSAIVATLATLATLAIASCRPQEAS